MVASSILCGLVRHLPDREADSLQDLPRAGSIGVLAQAAGSGGVADLLPPFDVHEQFGQARPELRRVVEKNNFLVGVEVIQNFERVDEEELTGARHGCLECARAWG